jgi:hypothetical protein
MLRSGRIRPHKECVSRIGHCAEQLSNPFFIGKMAREKKVKITGIKL